MVVGLSKLRVFFMFLTVWVVILVVYYIGCWLFLSVLVNLQLCIVSEEIISLRGFNSLPFVLQNAAPNLHLDLLHPLLVLLWNFVNFLIKPLFFRLFSWFALYIFTIWTISWVHNGDPKLSWCSSFYYLWLNYSFHF